MKRIPVLARTHPFLLSLIVLLLVVIPGFIRIEQIQRNSCNAGNAARHDQIVLWSYIITKTANPPRTPEQAKVIADFNAQLHQIFAPRNCGKGIFG